LKFHIWAFSFSVFLDRKVSWRPRPDPLVWNT